jgi:hypothetical protein
MTDPPPLPPPPRRARLRPRAAVRVWAARLATLPLVAAAAWFVALLLADPLTRVAGGETMGQVTDVRPSAREHDGHHFDITFTYAAPGGVRRTGSGHLEGAGLYPPVVGRSVPILTPPPLPFCRPLLKDEDASLIGLVCGGLVAVAWCGLVVAFSTIAWIGPTLAARGVRDGVAVVGTVTAKRALRTKRSVRLEVAYQYAGNGQLLSGVADVPLALFDRLEVGAAVTVLHPPAEPGRSVLYETCDHRVCHQP